MTNTISIPKKITKRGELIIVPRAEYEKMLAVSRRLLLEEKDTDEAIRIFDKECKIGKLKKSSRFSEILKARK